MIEVFYCIDKILKSVVFYPFYSLLKHSSSHVLAHVMVDINDHPLASNWSKKLNKFGFDFELKSITLAILLRIAVPCMELTLHI